MQLESVKNFLRKRQVIYIYMIFALFTGGLMNLMIIPIFTVWFILTLQYIFKYNRGIEIDCDCRNDDMLRLFYIFPLAEILIHLFLSFGFHIFPGEVGNIIEHLLGAFFFTLLVNLYLDKFYKGLNIPKFIPILTIIGVTSFVGIFNEFWEFGLRAFAVTDYCRITFCQAFDGISGNYYYADTIKDMAINVVGSLTAVLFIFRKR